MAQNIVRASGRFYWRQLIEVRHVPTPAADQQSLAPEPDGGNAPAAGDTRLTS